MIDFGIEDNIEIPAPDQVIPKDLKTKLLNEIEGKTVNVSAAGEILTASNGGEYLRLSIQRNPHSLASTSDGRYFLRISDTTKPVLGDEFFRLAGEKDSSRWERIRTEYPWQRCDKDKLADFMRRIQESDRVSDFVKAKETKELLDHFGLTKDESDEMTSLGVLFIGTQPQRASLLNAPVVQCIKYDEYEQ